MRKCPGASAGGRQEGELIRPRRVHLSIEGEACAGEAQNAESNNGSIRLKIKNIISVH